VNGATVYLDVNDNGVFDDEEPTQLTDADGRFTFDRPCRADAPPARDPAGGARR
jgi:hypothetical protein